MYVDYLFVVGVLFVVVCFISFRLLLLMFILPIHVCYLFTYANTCAMYIVLFVCVHICCCFVVARRARALCQKPYGVCPSRLKGFQNSFHTFGLKISGQHLIDRSLHLTGPELDGFEHGLDVLNRRLHERRHIKHNANQDKSPKRHLFS